MRLLSGWRERLIALYRRQMLLWLFLSILVNRQCRWRTEGVRGRYLGVCPLLLGSCGNGVYVFNHELSFG